MKYLFLFGFILIPVLCQEVSIEHGDKYDTRTYIARDSQETLVRTSLNDTGDWYYYTNQDTGVKSEYRIPETEPDKDIITYYIFRKNIDDKYYYYKYSTSNVLTREEKGNFVKEPDNEESINVEGSYSYFSPNGVIYIQGYTADKNGFHTKVSFGSKVPIDTAASFGKSPPPPVAQEPLLVRMGQKGLGSDVIGCLIGGGCK